MFSGRISCKREELDLGITLKGGQSFRWVSIENGAKYRGSFSGHFWTLSQIEDNIFYKLHTKTLDSEERCVEALNKYFNLDVSLKENMEQWAARDPHFEKTCKNASGVRILDQDVVENLFSFICSSNNNISRISRMVEKMCTHFGKKACVIQKEQYYKFPTIDALAGPKVESVLSKEGFGYRSAYIVNTAKKLKKLGEREYLESLHKANGCTYEEARAKLMELPGIGPKVADCICLMSLGHLDAIPVDTHIFHVAQEVYLPDLGKQKTVTPRIHEEINKHLRELWGPLAGWAQALVFCAKISNKGNSAMEDPEKEHSKPKKKIRT